MRFGHIVAERTAQHGNLSNHARLSPPLIRHHYWLPQARPQPHATPGPSPALRSSWQMSDYPPNNPSDQHRQKSKTSVGARTRRSSSSPAALSSRVAVSRTIFSLSRTRFACRMKRNVEHWGGSNAGKREAKVTLGRQQRTTFLASHDSAPSPLAVMDSSFVSFCTTSAR